MSSARFIDVFGKLCLPIATPAVAYYLWFAISEFDGALFVPDLKMLAGIPAPTAASIALYSGWLLLQGLLYVLAPGKVREGTPLTDGTRLQYKMNGWFAFWATLGLFCLGALTGMIPATIFFDQLGPLLTTANIAAFGLSFFVFFRGRSRTASHFVLGTELNPRVRGFDLKFFCESRPGLILWTLVNFSFAAAQYQSYGRLTLPMILVVAFQFLYVADYFYNEEAILTTWDIKHENFGWMLCWGCVVWVPFTYTLQAQYLVHHTHNLSVFAAAAIVGLNVLGYVVFRGSNTQKHNFRRNPGAPIWGKAPQYIRTAQGSLLLTSGWWGLSRHSNYFGDLLMALAWCLPVGFGHALPYFYLVYIVLLLVHREWRDNAACRIKYGSDWDTYCRRVRWRIVPGIY